MSAPAASTTPSGVSPVMNRLADHWGLVLTYGLITVALGIVLAVWPDETLVVLAVLAIQLIVAGVLRLVLALASSSLDGGVRALIGLSGALAVIVGLLCLRSPLQTVLVIGLILGVWWLVSGFIDIIGAVLSSHSDHRGWDIAMGVITVTAGGVLVLNPEASLNFLVIVAAVWLCAAGVIAIATALRLRSLRGTAHRPAAAPAV